jgi:hypothetical protein
MAAQASGTRFVGLLPRLVRLRDAPDYLGMDRNRFNAEVRPVLTEVPIGSQGVAFDRLELDRWADEYISRNGRPGRRKGAPTWDVNAAPDSTSATGSGTSTKSSEVIDFAKAVEKVTSKKRKSIS